MAYIGRDTDKISNVEVLDNITFDGSSSYTLQKNSVNFTPSSANTLLVSIDGVVQAGNFTVSGSTIDFGTAVAGTSTCDFILHYGVGLITAPSDGTVTTAKLADDAVTLAKMASGTDGNIISYDASGNPVAVATGTDGQVLTSTGAGSPPAFETLPSSNPYTALSKAEAGYITLVGGLIIQWGVFGTFGGTVSTGSVTFPITFPNARFSIVTSLWNGNNTTLNSLVLNSTISTSGFTWYQPDTSQSGRVGSYIVTGH